MRSGRRRKKKEPNQKIVGQCLVCKKKVREGEEVRRIHYMNRMRRVHPGCLNNPEIERWNTDVRSDRFAE